MVNRGVEQRVIFQEKEDYEKSKANKTYENQLKSNKAYYKSNKDEYLKKKFYKDVLDSKAKARKKILYFLNNDENDSNTIRKTTIEKFDLKLVDSKWI